MTSIKKLLTDEIQKGIDEKIKSIKQSIESAKESRDNETKSSVGDKYETGRTLMQMEVEKNRIQLNKTEFLKAEISKINPQKKFTKVEFGCLVKTSQNNYFISAALGKIELDHKTYFCISLASPIGKLLYNKTTGDKFIFQGKEIEINEIL